MEKAKIRAFGPGWIPPCTRPESFNNDPELASFTPSRYTWEAEQRKGRCVISPILPTALTTHARRWASNSLSPRRPRYPRKWPTLEFTQNATTATLTEFWTVQLAKVREIVADAAAIRTQWEGASPRAATRKPPSVRTVALLRLMKGFGLGGDRWARQFVSGVPIIGEIEQTGVILRDTAKKPPPPIQAVWKRNSGRFQTRCRSSGALNARLLWDEALGKVQKGWLGDPIPIDMAGNLSTFGKNGVAVALRFGVDQMDKLRACGDLKYSTTNMYCTVWTPIKLPTWGHIGQMALNIADPRRSWSFMKRDHEAAYKQLPLGDNQTKYAMVALRHPTAMEWRAFPPRSFLVGAEAAAIHYNSYPRAAEILAPRIFGIPLISYYDDIGALIPSDLG